MRRSEMRSCTFKVEYILDGRLVARDEVGVFHSWGLDYEDGENPISFTCGVVEDNNGQVHIVNPRYIKFLD